MEEVFSDFATYLSERLHRGVFTSEDSVRYTFFHALVSSGSCSHSDIVLEMPHPALSGKKIDTVIEPSRGGPSAALEFKYHSRIPSGENQPRPQNAGKCFDDIFRLARLTEPEATVRFFVYVTDDEMAEYLHNPRNGLSEWFDLPHETPYRITREFIARRPPTFQKEANKHYCPRTVTCHFSRELRDSHWLKVYRVET